MRRKPLPNKKRNNRVFNKTASKVHKKNRPGAASVMRGGIRL